MGFLSRGKYLLHWHVFILLFVKKQYGLTMHASRVHV